MDVIGQDADRSAPLPIHASDRERLIGYAALRPIHPTSEGGLTPYVTGIRGRKGSYVSLARGGRKAGAGARTSARGLCRRHTAEG